MPSVVDLQPIFDTGDERGVGVWRDAPSPLQTGVENVVLSVPPSVLSLTRAAFSSAANVVFQGLACRSWTPLWPR